MRASAGSAPSTAEEPSVGGGVEVVVTGMGAVSPLGVGADLLYERWLSGEAGIEGGLARASAFDPLDHLSAKEARRSDRFTQLAIVAAGEALAGAGWEGEPPYAPLRVATVVGTGIGGIQTLEEQWRVMEEKGPKRLSPLGVPLMMPNAAAATLAMRHGFRGAAIGVVSACAAGANAIGTALRMLQHGEADAVLAGGTEAAITDYSVAAFREMGALSKLGVSRPFDSERDGFVLGEGAGMFVLERRGAAVARGAEILGSIRGYASTVDAYHLTAPEPTGSGAAAALRGALDDAGLGPADVGYLNAHGTSTPLNDSAEGKAIRQALGAAATSVPISSTKSAIGHLLGAGGAVEAVATLRSLAAGVAPPNLGLEHPDPEFADLDLIVGAPRRLDPSKNIALSSSFGFGGHNAVLALAGPEVRAAA